MQLAIAEILLSHGADVNFNVEKCGTTTLSIQGVFHGNKDMVEMLLRNGADVNIQKFTYYGSALFTAAHEGHTDIAPIDDTFKDSDSDSMTENIDSDD